MAVDKKGDYYNPPSDYQDLDGNWKTFTYIDHDKHTSRTKMGRETEETKQKKQLELEQIRETLRIIRENRIKFILDQPACQVAKDTDSFMNRVLFEEILIRDSEPMTWNEQVLREACNLDENFLKILQIRVEEFHGFRATDNNPED